MWMDALWVLGETLPMLAIPFVPQVVLLASQPTGQGAMPLVTAAALAGLSLLLAWFWQYFLKRKRLIENVPSCKVAGIFIGLNEVKGQVVCEEPLKAFVSEQDCVWYGYSIDERYERSREVRDQDGKTTTEQEDGWKRVADGSECCSFYLRDDTGSVLVRPEGAEFTGNAAVERDCYRPKKGLLERLDFEQHPYDDRDIERGLAPPRRLGDDDPLLAKLPERSIPDGTGWFRLREHIICPDDRLFVMASARPREDVAEAELGYAEEDDLLVLSVEEEESIVRGLYWSGLACGGAGLLAALASVHMLLQGEVAVLLEPQHYALAGAGYAGLLALGYLVMLYNGLVAVRHRMTRSWTLIDIQLKRRSDLIPRLAECVKGFAQHEQEVQAALAEMRATRAGESPSAAAGADPVSTGAGEGIAQGQAITRLFGLAESYPDLKASALYQELHSNLVDSEDRIALARRFFNDSVTAYNDRIGTLPDLFLARVTGHSAARLYQVDAAEASAVAVSLD